MFNDTPEFKIEIPSQTRYLKMVVELTRNIALFVGFSVQESQKISLALDEAVTNIIKHSYLNEPGHTLRIDYFIHNSGIKIKLAYSGIPPRIAESRKNVQDLIREKRKGGLGVRLMKTIMDEVVYKTVKEKNFCEMVKWKKTS